MTGLSSHDASQLCNFEHVRQSSSAENVLSMKKQEIRAVGSNLDDLSHDTPLHVWSVQLSNGATHVTLRNLLWPGYQFDLDVGVAATQTEGYEARGTQAYFGTAQRNHDLIFSV